MADYDVPITLHFDGSVGGQMRSWIQDALNYSRFKVAAGNLDITIRVMDEPPCPGHDDYMCTQTTFDPATGVFTSEVTIRTGADNPEADFNSEVKGNLKDFFMESVVHEIIGHAFPFTHMAPSDASKQNIASWFYREVPGEAPKQGTLADWNNLEAAWPDRIQEALAEVLKDIYLPDQYRFYDNRTNWKLNRDNFVDLLKEVEKITCLVPPAGGGDT